MNNKMGDYYVQLEYLKHYDTYKVFISNGFQLPDPGSIGFDCTKTIPDNPGHQQGVRYLMRSVPECLKSIPESKWVIHIHNDVYILDFSKIDEITDKMVEENKLIAAFAWYGENTLSTDFFIVDRQWALANDVFMFDLDSGLGVEGDLYYKATKNYTSDDKHILVLDYELSKDKQEVRSRNEGGARNMPWREKYRILHDHLGEYFKEMREYGIWTEVIEDKLRRHRDYNNE
jgi:hypothetical protein